MKKHGLTHESARIARRHKAGSLGNLLGQSSPPPARDAKRDNVKKVCAMSKEVQRRRKEAEESADTDFKLKQFVNVPSRLHQTPKRYTPVLHGSEASPSTSRPRSASTPALSPAKLSPPVTFAGEGGRSAWARAPLRPCNEALQVKPGSVTCKASAQASTAVTAGKQSFTPPSRTCQTSDANSFGKPRRLFSEETAVEKPGSAVERERAIRPGTAHQHQHASSSGIAETPAWWPAPEKAAVGGRPSARTPRASSCGAAPKAVVSPQASQSQARGLANAQARAPCSGCRAIRAVSAPRVSLAFRTRAS
eukprot:TRINITY_DN8964_c0_g1_i1.p1 TRINITY_DN8964_c0_g1~~TRINITY_DN8964_c0_g1_i1.p1  ORF type:complete len:307 (-),score=48.50 TRINITY_DN8964_c0_g1_i1:233-1153(-)